MLAGCNDEVPTPTNQANVLSFGGAISTDLRVLNYLLFIKQLQYEFYNKVITTVPADLSVPELAYFRDLRDHELVHRQVLNDILSTNSIGQLTFDFASVGLATRAGVLAAAQKLEDTGAGAFLGVLPQLTGALYFALVAKMASVEARHSALVRDLTTTTTAFANEEVVSASGLQAGQGVALTPAQVATTLAPFVPTLTINVDSLPTA